MALTSCPGQGVVPSTSAAMCGPRALMDPQLLLSLPRQLQEMGMRALGTLNPVQKALQQKRCSTAPGQCSSITTVRAAFQPGRTGLLAGVLQKKHPGGGSLDRPFATRREQTGRARAASPPSSFFEDREEDEAGVLFPPSTPAAGPSQARQVGGMDIPEAPKEVQLIACLATPYNMLNILEFPDIPAEFGPFFSGARIMKLDSTNNIHSFYHKKRLWTDSYWDQQAAVTPLTPATGSIGVLGLAGGTVARLIRLTWPDRVVEGWEIDPMVTQFGRDFFGMAEVEAASPEGGKLLIHVADAFEAVSTTPEGFACIMVDLFANGEVLPQLKDVEVWKKFKARLAPEGRVVANLGGPSLEPSLSATDDAWLATVAAMKGAMEAFPGEAYYLCTHEDSSDVNHLVMTGGPFDPDEWASKLPSEITEMCYNWKPLIPGAACFTR